MPVQKHKSVLALSVLVLLGGCASQPAESAWLDDPKFVEIEVKGDQPSLSSNQPDPKRFSGFEIELATEFAAAFDRELDLKATISEHRAEALESGRSDAVIASYSMNPQRKAKVDMVGPYLLTRTGIMVRSGYSGSPRIADFPSHRLCTVKGSVTIDLIVDATGGQPRDEPGFKDCSEELEKGLVDAVVTDKIILEGLAAESDGAFRVLPRDFGPDQYYGIAIPPGHLEQCERLESWVREYVTSNRWINNFTTHFPDVDWREYAVTGRQVDERSECSAAEKPPE